MITLKGIIDEDFVNYKVPSMVLMFPRCSFKCGSSYCQNSALTKEKDIEISVESIYERYINNEITKAIVFQGLEPLDSWDDVKELLYYFRIIKDCHDDFVIYTGYNKEEIVEKISYIKLIYTNVIIKYGRYIDGQKPHKDGVLSVSLASDNQYAEKIT